MANVKITALTNLSSADVDAADVFVIDDVSATQTKKITVANLQSAIDTIATSNINTVSANADAYYVQLNANINVVQDNVTAQNSYITSTYATLLLLDSVQDNVGSAESNVSAVEARRASNTFYDYTTNFNVLVTANVEPQQNNIYSLGAPDLVWKDLHVGPGSIFLGDLTLAPNDDATGIVITGADASTTTIDTSVANVTATLNLLQDNVAAAEANVVSAETRLNANLDIIQDNVSAIVDATAVETRLNANLDITNDNVTSLTTTVDSFGTYANTNLDTKANVSATYFLALANDYATHTQLSANLDVVQDNVATLTTTVDNFGTYANTNLDTKANVSATYFLALANDFATYSLINANLDVVQDNVATLTTTVDNFGTSSNANATALALEDVALQTRLGANVTSLSNEDTALQSRLSSNVTALQNEDTALQSRLSSNVTALQNEDTALQARIAANALVAASNDYVTYTRLDANVSAVQDNVAAAEANIASIIDGSTAFTGDVTMNQALTVSGNLYVVGAQVDLGISSAQIDDATLLLAANTPADAQLGVDSGIVINRGQDANVFFGFAQYGDHIDFIFTDAPADNAAHYAIAYIDVHANSFGAEGTHDPTFTAIHHADRPTTGFYFPTNEIVGVIGGAYKANITASGLEAVAVYSDGVELQANDSATLFSAYANDYATHTQITANVDIVQDNVAQNATDISAIEARRTANIAGAVSTITTSDLTASRALASDGSGKVAVSAVTATELGYLDGVTSAIQTQIDSKIATTASAANDYVTYTQLNANINVVQDNVATKLDSSSYTASDVLTKIKTVDGAGSGLDADLLDGQSSAYFAVEATRSSNAAALAAGIATKLDSSDYTASDVLTKVKTVDGAGSGLDADLLDGQSSAYYAVEATRSSNAAALAAGIAGITPIGTSDISNGAVTVDKLAATLDLGALS